MTRVLKRKVAPKKPRLTSKRANNGRYKVLKALGYSDKDIANLRTEVRNLYHEIDTNRI